MSDVLYNPPIRITVPTPIASVVRDYRRGIHNRSNSDYQASIRLSTEEGTIIEQACEILQIDNVGAYMRWCATQCAEEIVADHRQWEKHDAIR